MAFIKQNVSGAIDRATVFSLAVWMLAIPLLLVIASVAAHEAESKAVVESGFVPPKPGTYSLQKIMSAPDGSVLDIDGSQLSLSDVTKGKLTLLGFIYTRCPDGQGCPLTYHVFRTLQRRLANLPGLSDKVRLVNLSFDPIHDTPEVMKAYGGKQARSVQVEWRFLTTESVRDLMPLLKGFGQDVSVRADENVNALSTFSHVLKVFLIDTGGMVREIYSTAFLLPDVLLTDLRTLMMEDENADSDELAYVGCLVCDIHGYRGILHGVWD